MYVAGLALPILYSLFELLRLFTFVDQSVQTAIYLFFFKIAIFFAGSYVPNYFFSKCIAQRRIWSSWFVLLICAFVTIAALQFISPNSLGFQVLPPLPRFYVSFNWMALAPCFMIRSFSQDASPVVIAVVFTILISYLPRYSKNPLISSNVLLCNKTLSFFVVEPSSTSTTPHRAHSHLRYSLLKMHRDFWLPYADEQSPLRFIAGAKRFYSDSHHSWSYNWLVLVVLQFVLEMYMVLVTTLLDKKHTAVPIGRKFFQAETADENVGKRH